MISSKRLSPAAVGWLTSGERGISSDALFNQTMFGTPGSQWANWPHDPSDFRRCHLLVRAVPEVRTRLSVMAKVGPQWAQLVEHWNEIADLLEAEVPGVFNEHVSGNAPRTYKLMRSLIDSCQS